MRAWLFVCEHACVWGVVLRVCVACVSIQLCCSVALLCVTLCVCVVGCVCVWCGDVFVLVFVSLLV